MLSTALQDEQTARLVLRAMKKCSNEEGPALIIVWNDAGFNDVPAVPGCRNGIPGQTMQPLLSPLDLYQQHSIQWKLTIPAWYKKYHIILSVFLRSPESVTETSDSISLDSEKKTETL